MRDNGRPAGMAALVGALLAVGLAFLGIFLVAGAVATAAEPELERPSPAGAADAAFRSPDLPVPLKTVAADAPRTTQRLQGAAMGESTVANDASSAPAASVTNPERSARAAEPAPSRAEPAVPVLKFSMDDPAQETRREQAAMDAPEERTLATESRSAALSAPAPDSSAPAPSSAVDRLFSFDRLFKTDDRADEEASMPADSSLMDESGRE